MNEINEWQKEKDRFRRLREEQPENGSMWFEYAEFLKNKCDNPELAVRAYEKAQQYLPGKDFRLRLGAAYADAGEYERGISLINEYLEEKPCAHGYVFLSEAYKQADKLAEAKKALETAINMEPAFEEPYYLMGELVKDHSREDAIQYFRKATSLDPNYQLAWRALGAKLIDEDDSLKEGIDALRRAISLNPEDGWAHAYLAIGYWKAGELDDADAQYKRAIEAFPDFQLFRDYYADYLTQKAALSEKRSIEAGKGDTHNRR